MLLYLFLCNILFISSIANSVSNTSASDHISTAVFNTKLDEKVESVRNQSKLSAVSEGGPILQTTPLGLNSPEENKISINKELTNDKSLVLSNSKVVAKKGVYYDDNLSNKESNKVTLERNFTLIANLKNVSSIENSTQSPDLLKNTISNVNLTSDQKQGSGKINDTKVPTKPPILDHIGGKLTDTTKKTLISDQLPSPNVRKNAVRHPGMVIPVVITILVVPMFAVLGYMALKRGQEAWRNRHYKRMDFLLDGMYND